MARPSIVNTSIAYRKKTQFNAIKCPPAISKNGRSSLGGLAAHLDDVFRVFHDNHFHGRNDDENSPAIPRVSFASLSTWWVVGPECDVGLFA